MYMYMNMYMYIHTHSNAKQLAITQQHILDNFGGVGHQNKEAALASFFQVVLCAIMIDEGTQQQNRKTKIKRQ